VPALKVLEEYNMTGKVTVGDNVVVIGGGNVATDAAGAALRSGAKSVKLYCLEDRKTMPAHEWEIEEIAHDGVELNPSWGPRAILGDGEKVTSVEFMRCKSVFDENKRFNPVYDEKVIETVEADTVITAIGQGPDLSFLGEGINVFRGAVAIDKYTMETSLAGVFAGGDAAAGTASLVEAITAGKTAADSIKKYINGLEKE
ncbi:MAG: FAD-dependent oxidoreductase, partial [Oscillospiraceae bacterium]|nr:FAD-dependent oxidoreductase [Oscillospiraceae bacterium]